MVAIVDFCDRALVIEAWLSEGAAFATDYRLRLAYLNGGCYIAVRVAAINCCHLPTLVCRPVGFDPDMLIHRDLLLIVILVFISDAPG